MWLCFCRESKNKEWPRPCFCRGSSAKTNVNLLLQGVNISTNLNNCDFASAESWKIKNGQDLASAGDQVPKQMWPCFCRGSTYQNFESEDNFSLDLVLEDHGTTFLNSIPELFLNECMFECVRIYDLPLLWMHLWMHDVFF